MKRFFKYLSVTIILLSLALGIFVKSSFSYEADSVLRLAFLFDFSKKNEKEDEENIEKKDDVVVKRARQPEVKIHEINQRQLNYGTYLVQGYVVKKYSCPPCPEGALCKPCMEDHIVISEEKKPLDDDHLSYKELIVFVETSDDFKLKRRYRFLIKILDVKTTSQVVNNIQLIHAQEIKGRHK